MQIKFQPSPEKMNPHDDEGMDDDEDLNQSEIPFIREAAKDIFSYIRMSESDDPTVKGISRDILEKINFSQCIPKLGDKKVMQQLIDVACITSNILQLQGKDMVAEKLLEPVTLFFLISDLFKVLTSLSDQPKCVEILFEHLLIYQDSLFEFFPVEYQVFFYDIHHMLSELVQIYMYFVQTRLSGTKNKPNDFYIVFLPEVFKRYGLVFYILEVPSEEKCIFFQKYISQILKHTIEKYPSNTQARELFGNICQQIRFSSNSIKLCSLEIVNIYLSKQILDPTISKLFINILNDSLNCEQSKLPLFRSLEFDDLMASILKNLRNQFKNLSHISLDKKELLETCSRSLYWNISNSKSELLKCELIETLVFFFDNFPYSYIEVLLKVTRDIGSCLKNQMYPANLDKMVTLIKKLMTLHYDNSNEKKRSQSDSNHEDSDSQKKKRKITGDEDVIMLSNEEVNLSFSTNENQSSSLFGSGFCYMKDIEESRMLFDMILKRLEHISTNEEQISFMKDLYVLIMSLVSFDTNNDNKVLQNFIDIFVGKLKIDEKVGILFWWCVTC